MRIVDVGPAHLDEFCHCLGDSEDARDGSIRRRAWVDAMTARGLRAKLALDDTERPVGMIQYVPSREVLIDRTDLYYVHCIWVPPHDAFGGKVQRHGIGTALLMAAEHDAESLGAKGMVAWGIRFPVWMKASWFAHHGYRRADRSGIVALMWKPFTHDATPPRFAVEHEQHPDRLEGKVRVTCLVNGWCAAANAAYERAKRAAEEIGEPVVFEEIDTLDPAVARQWGASDALFIDGKKVWTGPPPSYATIRRKIERRVRALHR